MSKEKEYNPIGRSWDDFEREIFTEEEIAASDLRVNIICELIEARKKMGITQKMLEKMSGVRQPIIARMERGHTDPQIGTVLKLLVPLGKTLYVGDIKTKDKKIRIKTPEKK